jgi:hypothetical protein
MLIDMRQALIPSILFPALVVTALAVVHPQPASAYTRNGVTIKTVGHSHSVVIDLSRLDYQNGCGIPEVVVVVRAGSKQLRFRKPNLCDFWNTYKPQSLAYLSATATDTDRLYPKLVDAQIVLRSKKGSDTSVQTRIKVTWGAHSLITAKIVPVGMKHSGSTQRWISSTRKWHPSTYRWVSSYRAYDGSDDYWNICVQGLRSHGPILMSGGRKYCTVSGSWTGHGGYWSGTSGHWTGHAGYWSSPSKLLIRR